jgi:hypothetical protein
MIFNQTVYNILLRMDIHSINNTKTDIYFLITVAICSIFKQQCNTAHHQHNAYRLTVLWDGGGGSQRAEQNNKHISTGS